MDISQMIQTLLGTVIGGAIVIATYWVHARLDRQKSAQDWYEQTYIREGLDPVMTYLLNLRLHILNADIQNTMQLPSINVLPLEALSRVQLLLGDTTINGIIVLIHASLTPNKQESNIKASAAALQTSKILLSLRQEILKISSTKLKSKSYQIDSSATLSKANSIFAELYQDNKHVTSWMRALKEDESKIMFRD